MLARVTRVGDVAVRAAPRRRARRGRASSRTPRGGARPRQPATAATSARPGQVRAGSRISPARRRRAAWTSAGTPASASSACAQPGQAAALQPHRRRVRQRPARRAEPQRERRPLAQQRREASRSWPARPRSTAADRLALGQRAPDRRGRSAAHRASSAFSNTQARASTAPRAARSARLVHRRPPPRRPLLVADDAGLARADLRSAGPRPRTRSRRRPP